MELGQLEADCPKLNPFMAGVFELSPQKKLLYLRIKWVQPNHGQNHSPKRPIFGQAPQTESS